MVGTPADVAYVKPPDTTHKATVDVVPAGIGSKWVYDVEMRSTQTGTVVAKGAESAEYTKTRRIGDIDGVVCERRRNNGAEVVSQEVYALSKDGYSQIAMGKTGEAILEPPLTIWKFPAVAGDTHLWNGSLRVGKGSVGGTGAVRAANLENVTTPAGTFQAWRVDSVMSIRSSRPNVPPQSVRSLSWFAPKIGIVQQQYREADQLITKRLHSYRLK